MHVGTPPTLQTTWFVAHTSSHWPLTHSWPGVAVQSVNPLQLVPLLVTLWPQNFAFVSGSTQVGRLPTLQITLPGWQTRRQWLPWHWYPVP
jgi:hypothetical protein